MQLLGSGTILREVIAAAELLQKDWGVAADVWSCTSFTELRRDGWKPSAGTCCIPTEPPRPTSTSASRARRAPSIAATDYMRAFADQIRPLGAAPYIVLGTDGFGRCDSARKLRRFFEVDRHYVAVAALKALADDGTLRRRVPEAIRKYGIDRTKPRRWRSDSARHDARRLARSEVKVPDIGDFKDVPVIEVLVKPGDAVKAEDSLVTLECDKATMEVPAPFAGVVKELRVGARVGGSCGLGLRSPTKPGRGRPGSASRWPSLVGGSAGSSFRGLLLGRARPATPSPAPPRPHRARPA